jgi:hypothetical protein
VFGALSPIQARGITVKTSTIVLSALVAGGALVSAGAANAALVHDLVTFSATDFTTGVPPGPAPVDPVTGSFTISFDTTKTYTDETAGITLNSLNIPLDSSISFDYSPTMTPTVLAGELIVGGVFEGANAILLGSPIPESDFYLHIYTFAATTTFQQLGYAEAGGGYFYTAGETGTVTVTPITSGVPEPSTWAMMLLGFAGLGYAGYRRAREPSAA